MNTGYYQFLTGLRSQLVAGVPLKQSLATLAGGGKCARLARESLASVDRGRTFAEALADVHGADVPSEHIVLVEAGERSGRLDTMIERIIADVELLRDMRTQMVSRSLYPLLILVATVMLPPLYHLFSGLVSEYLRIQLAFFGPIALLVVLWYQRDRIAPPASALRSTLQGVLRKVPVLGPFTVDHALSRSLSLLGLLLEAGLGWEDSLPLVGRASGWIFLEREFRAADEKIRQGATATESLCALSSLPRDFHSAIATGEVSGSLDSALKHCGEILRERTTTRVDRVLSVLPVVALLLAGLVAGLIVVRFYTSMYRGL